VQHGVSFGAAHRGWATCGAVQTADGQKRSEDQVDELPGGEQQPGQAGIMRPRQSATQQAMPMMCPKMKIPVARPTAWMFPSSDEPPGEAGLIPILAAAGSTMSVAAARDIARVAPDVAVLMFTMFDDDSVFAARRAGARGYVLKGAQQDEIVPAIQAFTGEALFGAPWHAGCLTTSPGHEPRRCSPT